MLRNSVYSSEYRRYICTLDIPTNTCTVPCHQYVGSVLM